jgi:hypothetical protein
MHVERGGGDSTIDVDSALGFFGARGWELVGVASKVQHYQDEGVNDFFIMYRYVLKRPVEEGADLRGQDLHGRDLSDVVFTRANLAWANLSG